MTTFPTPRSRQRAENVVICGSTGEARDAVSKGLCGLLHRDTTLLYFTPRAYVLYFNSRKEGFFLGTHIDVWIDDGAKLAEVIGKVNHGSNWPDRFGVDDAGGQAQVPRPSAR